MTKGTGAVCDTLCGLESGTPALPVTERGCFRGLVRAWLPWESRLRRAFLSRELGLGLSGHRVQVTTTQRSREHPH